MSRLLDFTARHWPLFLALAGVLALLVGSELQRWLRGLKKIAPADAVRLINQHNALIIDVRSDGEFKEGHIPHARHLPPASLNERLRGLEKYRGRPVIVYCRSGARAARVGGALRKHGFAEVFNLEGGLGSWQSANLPVQRGAAKG